MMFPKSMLPANIPPVTLPLPSIPNIIFGLITRSLQGRSSGKELRFSPLRQRHHVAPNNSPLTSSSLTPQRCDIETHDQDKLSQRRFCRRRPPGTSRLELKLDIRIINIVDDVVNNFCGDYAGVVRPPSNQQRSSNVVEDRPTERLCLGDMRGR